MDGHGVLECHAIRCKIDLRGVVDLWADSLTHTPADAKCIEPKRERGREGEQIAFDERECCGTFRAAWADITCTIR